MKATTQIPEGLFDNLDKFSDPFFKRFTLRPAPHALQLTETISKQYQFPTFYSDVTCAMGIFMCDFKKAAALMPHPAMKPIAMTRGRSLVTFSCYEYKNVMQVKPYNEVSMMIPVQFESTLHVPVLPLVASGLFPSFGYYVFSMPVTSKENQLRGNKFWGLPKVTQEIDIEEVQTDCVTTVKDADGLPYFELRVPMSGTPTQFDVQANLFSQLDGTFLTSRTQFKGDFQVTKHMGALLKKGGQPDRRSLTIGKSPAAQVLRDLEIEDQPFQFRFAKHMNAAFDLPHQTKVLPT